MFLMEHTQRVRNVAKDELTSNQSFNLDITPV